MKIPASGELHGRAIEEWVGKTPDTPAPAHVQTRVLLRQSRKCAISGRKIRPGMASACDHIKPLKAGGKNVESNLQIILVDPHKEKTAQEASVNAKVERLIQKNFGPKKPSRLPSRKFRVAGYVPNTKFVEHFD